MDINLNEKNKETLLKLARLTIAEHLGVKLDFNYEDLDFSDKIFHEKYGAFVTLHKQGRLRGCIGYIKGFMPLKDTIKEMAYSAGFKDPRFSPLNETEINQIDIEISILTPIVPVKDISEIVIGRDGLIISKGYNSGLLLPQVATEYNWNLEEFLGHTCQKAGLDENCWKEQQTNIEKFSAYVFGEKK